MLPLVPSVLRTPVRLTSGVMPQRFLHSTNSGSSSFSAFQPCRREVRLMQKPACIAPAVSFAFNRQVVGQDQLHDHGLHPRTSRRTVPSFTGAVASASPSASAPTCPGVSFTNQAPLSLAGITSRCSRRPITGSLRHRLMGAAELGR